MVEIGTCYEKGKLNAQQQVFDKSFKSSHFQELSEDAEVLADAYGEILKNTHLKVLFDILSQESRLKVLSNGQSRKSDRVTANEPKISFKGQEHEIMMRL